MKRGFEVWLNLSTSTFWRVVRCVMWDLSMTGVSAQHPVWRRYPAAAAAAGQCWPRWRWVKRHCEHQHGGRGGWQHCFHCALKERQQTAGDWTWLTTILVSHWFAYSFFVEPHLCFDSDSQFAVKSSLQLRAQFAFVVRCKMICHCVSVWTSTDGDGCVSVCLSVRIVVCLCEQVLILTVVCLYVCLLTVCYSEHPSQWNVRRQVHTADRGFFVSLLSCIEHMMSICCQLCAF